MDGYGGLLRPLLYRLDAETAHNLALWAISSGLVSVPRVNDPRLEQKLFGVKFPNPIGLAAGFDKNGVAIDRWDDLGFGFVELGTVTAHPQPGQPKPRLFRFVEQEALINWMGFNNAGADELAKKLKESMPEIPIGINIGKSAITPLESAPGDYRSSFQKLHRFGDYFVVNVSSPNTPSLRQLQDKAALEDILAAMQGVDSSRPIFVKVTPDLTHDALDDVIALASERKLAGLIATNTTTDRTGCGPEVPTKGGLSGKPLRERAQEIMAHLGKQCPKEMILIGVGGMFTAEDVWERMRAGAHLVQIYTGWVYGGPGLVARILKDLLARMEREGVRHVSEIRESA